MKVTWLGQAGLLFEKNGCKIVVDPYLSDSVEKINPLNYRRVPVCEDFLKITPDIIICTHDHLDHTDPETLEHYFKNAGKDMLVMAPVSAVNKIRTTFGGTHNYVMFNRHTEWTQNGIKFTAVKAEHSDLTGVGVIIDDGERKYYITGDTLYNTDIFGDLPENIDVMFLPVNGKGNNMNMADGVRFAARVGAKKVVPMHCGLFDEISFELFDCPNRVIPEFYKEINLSSV